MLHLIFSKKALERARPYISASDQVMLFFKKDKDCPMLPCQTSVFAEPDGGESGTLAEMLLSQNPVRSWY